jgi:hypothetical protein
MVCRVFLLAFRILGKIILTNGDTDWRKDGTPHYNMKVRQDFVDTDVGVRRVPDVIEVEHESSGVEQESSMAY